METDINFYYLTLTLIVACYLVAKMLTSSPFGQVLRAMRLNEQRTDLLGFRTKMFRIIAFTISGGYTGLAGGLIAPFLSHSAPLLAHWSVSGEVMMMTLIGGKGTLIGPVLGSGFIFFLKDIIGSLTQYWMFILGCIFVIFVILAPEGMMGILRMRVIKKTLIKEMS
jgi:branched-chain amino acid transport system permease protein